LNGPADAPQGVLGGDESESQFKQADLG